MGWLESLARDLRHAARVLRRRPTFALAAVLSLALGIGANTAMFTLLDGLLYRPLPVRDPDRLVRLASVDAQGRLGYLSSIVLDLIGRERMFDGLCAFLTPQSTVEMNGRVTAASAHALSGDCFETLGVRPTIGRLFGPADDREGAANVVVLTYDVWQSEFGGQSDVIGQVLKVEGESFTIVGVTERRFSGLLVGFPARLLFPIRPQAFLTQSLQQPFYSSNVFARLPSDRSREQVTERLRTLWPSLLENSLPPGYQGRQRAAYLASRLEVTPAATGIDFSLRDRFERPLMALLAIAILVLLVSCVNVANLMLARGVERRHEYAVRAAIGAGPGRLVQEGMAETVLLLVAGAGLGVALAYRGADVLVSIYRRLTDASFSLDLTPNTCTLAFTCATAVAAFLCFAVGPVWRTSRVDPVATLTASSRLTGDRSRLRQVLVVVQVAITLVLVTGATLFTMTLRELRSVPLGFETERLLSASLTPLPGGYDKPFEPGPYYRNLIEGVQGIPGVSSVALSSVAPLSMMTPRLDPVATSEAADAEIEAQTVRVSDGFFATLQIPLIAGNDFSRYDQAWGVKKAIVSESLALRLFGGVDIIERHIRVGVRQSDQTLQVVGIARDAVLGNPKTQNTLLVYLNYWQQDAGYQQWPIVIVRRGGGPAQVAGAVRAHVERAGHEYARSVETFDHNREAAILRERLLATTSTAFGALGLTLATVGLFGLLNFTVASRTREIGIRIALGAGRREVQWLVLRDALISIAAGVGLGLPLVWGGGRAVSTLLYGISPLDGRALAATIAVVTAFGIVGAWLPARRASAINPTQALRQD